MRLLASAAALAAVLVLLGCPRPLPDTPAPADLAALEARLTSEPVVAFQIGLRSRAQPGLDVSVRLGPGDRVEIQSQGEYDGVPAFSGRLGGASGDTRRHVVQHLLRRGAADLLTTLAATSGAAPPAPGDVPGLRTGGWENIDGGDARGLLFPADGSETVLWLNDATGLPVRRQTQRLRDFPAPPEPVEVYSGWTFEN